MKKILIILLMLFLICNIIPNASAQAVSGWEVSVDRPFYFVGDTMNVTVTGINGMNYSIDLVNTTTWLPIHLITRGIGPTGMDRFDFVLNDEWVKGGRYYLNVSVDGFHMAHRLIRIDYSADYLHNKEHDWLRDSVAWIERALNNIYDDLISLSDDVQMAMRANFVLMVLVLIIGGQVFLHVIIPVFYAWAQRQQRRGHYKQFRYGCTANQIQWHDRNLPTIHADHVPNVKTLAENAIASGLTPEMGKVVVWGAIGSPGDGDFTRDYMARLKWKKIIAKAFRALRLERGVAGAAYVEAGDNLHKEFQMNLKKIEKEYREEIKSATKSVEVENQPEE